MVLGQGVTSTTLIFDFCLVFGLLFHVKRESPDRRIARVGKTVVCVLARKMTVKRGLGTTNGLGRRREGLE